MYYEEMMIDGILCWRSGPNDPWTRFTIQELSARAHQVARLTAELAQVREERDELLENLNLCKGNELAEENERLKEWATVDKKQLTEALQREARLHSLLTHLHALVWGECRSLLDDDSGGPGWLDNEIRDAIKEMQP